MTIADVLSYKYSEYQWSVGEDYESLFWDPANGIAKPSQQQIDTDTAEYNNYINSLAKFREFVNNRLWPFLDKKAADKGYCNAANCSALVTSSIQSVRNDAQAFNAWRDSVLIYINQVYQDITNEVRTKPTLQELLDELPTLEWP